MPLIEIFVLRSSLAMYMDIIETYDDMIGLGMLLCMFRTAFMHV